MRCGEVRWDNVRKFEIGLRNRCAGGGRKTLHILSAAERRGMTVRGKYGWYALRGIWRECVYIYVCICICDVNDEKKDKGRACTLPQICKSSSPKREMRVGSIVAESECGRDILFEILLPYSCWVVLFTLPAAFERFWWKMRTANPFPTSWYPEKKEIHSLVSRTFNYLKNLRKIGEFFRWRILKRSHGVFLAMQLFGGLLWSLMVLRCELLKSSVSIAAEQHRALAAGFGRLVCTWVLICQDRSLSLA